MSSFRTRRSKTGSRSLSRSPSRDYRRDERHYLKGFNGAYAAGKQSFLMGNVLINTVNPTFLPSAESLSASEITLDAAPAQVIYDNSEYYFIRNGSTDKTRAWTLIKVLKTDLLQHVQPQAHLYPLRVLLTGNLTRKRPAEPFLFSDSSFKIVIPPLPRFSSIENLTSLQLAEWIMHQTKFLSSKGRLTLFCDYMHGTMLLFLYKTLRGDDNVSHYYSMRHAAPIAPPSQWPHPKFAILFFQCMSMTNHVYFANSTLIAYLTLCSLLDQQMASLNVTGQSFSKSFSTRFPLYTQLEDKILPELVELLQGEEISQTRLDRMLRNIYTMTKSVSMKNSGNTAVTGSGGTNVLNVTNANVLIGNVTNNNCVNGIAKDGDGKNGFKNAMTKTTNDRQRGGQVSTIQTKETKEEKEANILGVKRKSFRTTPALPVIPVAPLNTQQASHTLTVITQQPIPTITTNPSIVMNTPSPSPPTKSTT